MATAFRCTVVTPSQQLFDDEVVYASIPAWDGLIGVEHLRAPLLAKLGFGTLTLRFEKGDPRRFYVGGGFAQVKDDVLTLLTDEAAEAGDLDRDESEAALKEALAYAPTDPAGQAKRDRDLDRARAKVALTR